MNLIRIRFINQWPEEQFNLIQNKRLFYLFIQQLFIRPSIDIKDGLISCCTDADLVCKEISLNKYTKVNKALMNKYLIDNTMLSQLNIIQQPANFLNSNHQPTIHQSATSSNNSSSSGSTGFSFFKKKLNFNLMA